MSLSESESEAKAKEVGIAQAAMLEADRIAKERRIRAEFDEKHGIKTKEDADKFIQKCKDEIFAKLAKLRTVAFGKKGVPVPDKKKCINCGGKVVRQHDETKSTVKEIAWTGYDCLVCGEKGMII